MKIKVTYKSKLTRLFLAPIDISVMEFHKLATIEGDLIIGVMFV